MEKFVTKDGVQLAYDVTGEGKPLLLLGDWISTSAFFNKNLPGLSRDCKVVRMDYRGCGESDKVENGYRISRFAADARELLEYLDLQDVTLVGWGMGAFVAWMYWELFQADRISKIVFVDQSPDNITDQTWKWGCKDCYDVYTYTRLMMSHELDYDGEQKHWAWANLLEEPSPEADDLFYTERMKTLPYGMLQIRKDYTFKDYRDLMATITLPCLGIACTNSPKFDVAGIQWAAEQIPNCRVEIFEESGHLPFYEETEKFDRVVSQFVNE